MFSEEDRRLLRQNNQLIAQLNDRQQQDIRAQIVEQNRLLKQLLDAQDGISKADADAAVEKGNKIVDNLQGIQDNV